MTRNSGMQLFLVRIAVIAVWTAIADSIQKQKSILVVLREVVNEVIGDCFLPVDGGWTAQ
jgi:hypothetical protein